MLAESRTRSDASEREKILEHDNFKMRRKFAIARDQIATLQEQVDTGTVPEGSVVVKKEDADELAAFRALKLKPDEVKKTVDDLGKLAQEKAVAEAESVFADAAESLAFPNVAAVTKALKKEGLLVEMRAVKEDDPENPGKKITVQRAFCRKRDDEKAAFEPLGEYIDREIPEFVAAFDAEPDVEEEGDEQQGVQGRRAASQERRTGASGNGAGAGGVAVATMRRASAPSGTARAEQQQKDALDKKRRTGGYSL